MIDNYPQDSRAYGSLGSVFSRQGQYEKGTEITKESLRLAPDVLASYSSLANYAIALPRFDETRQIIRETQTRKVDSNTLHDILYGLAFLSSDATAMAE